MKLATWNVNSILARLPLVTRWLDKEKRMFSVSRKPSALTTSSRSLRLNPQVYDCVLFGQQSYNGVAILSKDGCALVQRGYPEDDVTSHSRLLAVDVGAIRVVNVYVPNGQVVGSDKYEFKLKWLKRLRQMFDESYDTSTPVLLCGDFNVAPEERDVHDPRLWQNRILFSPPEREALQNIKDWGFTDTFRMHTDEAGHYSWWDYRAGGFRRKPWFADRSHMGFSPARRAQHTHLDRQRTTWLGTAF
jgi:exodeoxyribonuclease-3